MSTDDLGASSHRDPIGGIEGPPFAPLGPGDRPVLIVVHGLPEETIESLQRHLPHDRCIETAESLDAAVRAWRRHAPAVLCIAGSDGAETLGEQLARAQSPLHTVAPPRTVIVVGTGDALETWAAELPAPSVFFLAAGMPSGKRLAPLLEAATRSLRRAPDDRPTPSATDTAAVLAWADRAHLQSSFDELAALWRTRADELVDLRRAYLLRFDPSENTLAGPDAAGGERLESAVAGVSSWVARTGRSVRLACLRDDPCFERDADDPVDHGGADHGGADHGDMDHGDARFLAVPLTSTLGVEGVIIAVRNAADAAFSPRDELRLRLLADQLAPLFLRWAPDALAPDSRLAEGGLDETQLRIHRPNAVAHYIAGRNEAGGVLDLDPRWMRLSFLALLIAALAIALIATFGSVTEYASGPAVVRAGGDAGPVSIVALLPAAARPRLRVGKPLRISLDGYGDVLGTTAITRIGDEILSEAQAREWAEGDLGEGVSGAAVVVHTELATSRFVANGEALALFPGMTGEVEVPLRKRSVIAALISPSGAAREGDP